MTDGRNFFDQAVKTDLITYDNIQKIATGEYFKKYCKMIAIDFRKQQVFDADPKAIQIINFIGNLDQAVNTIMFLIIESAKKAILDYNTRNCQSIVNLFCCNIISI